MKTSIQKRINKKQYVEAYSNRKLQNIKLIEKIDNIINIRPIYIKNNYLNIYYKIKDNYWLSLRTIYDRNMYFTLKPKIIETLLINVCNLASYNELYVKKYGYENGPKKFYCINEISEDDMVTIIIKEINYLQTYLI